MPASPARPWRCACSAAASRRPWSSAHRRCARAATRSTSAARSTAPCSSGSATVHIDRYASGRIALIGDAAYGGTLGGQGTSLSIVGAYVLAGELARGGAPEAALRRYEAVMRPYATRCQKGAMRAGSFFAPQSAAGLWLRNRVYGMLTAPRWLGLFERMVTDAATDFTLPEYCLGEAAPAAPRARPDSPSVPSLR